MMDGKTEEHSLPNIILILADDMGFSDVGCYGGEIDTPNIDKLADRGIRFTNFCNTARCCPSRASILTGLHPHQTGIGYMTNSHKSLSNDWGIYGYRGFLNRNCVTLAEVLKQRGYHTYLSGKWHVGQHGEEKWPLQRGFERFYGTIGGGCNYFKPRAPRGLTLDNSPVEPEGENYYTTDAFTDYAIKFLKEKNDKSPFFLYLAYNSPHWPLQAKNEDVEKYVGKYMCGWDTVREARYRRLIEKGIINEKWRLSPRDPCICGWDELDEEKKKEMDYRMSVYAAQVHCMDYNIGKLAGYLEETGQLENSLILFLSDNGGCAEGGDMGGGPASEINQCELTELVSSYGKAWANASNTPFRYYKHYVHEGGIATPFIAHWPRVIKDQCSSINRSSAYLIDIMPTILEITGANYPERFNDHSIHPLEGKSMLSIFTEGKWEEHEYMFWEHENNCTIRYGRWKAIGKYDTQEWELYDMEDDRTEVNNLAGQNRELVKELTDKWLEWAKSHHVVPKEKV